MHWLGAINGNSMFSGNSARWGGGICALGRSTVDIGGNSTFRNNSATWGGGVSLWGSSTVEIRGNSTFNGNLARRYGGGVSAMSHSNVHISGNSTFSDKSVMGQSVHGTIAMHVDISGNTVIQRGMGVVLLPTVF